MSKTKDLKKTFLVSFEVTEVVTRYDQDHYGDKSSTVSEIRRDLKEFFRRGFAYYNSDVRIKKLVVKEKS